MSSKYSTIQQHEPLRAPAGWSAQEKRFVAQLEEILDDLYSRFNRLGLKDLNGELRGTIIKTVDGVKENSTAIEQSSKSIQLIAKEAQSAKEDAEGALSAANEAKLSVEPDKIVQTVRSSKAYQDDMGDKADKSEIPDVSGLASKSDIPDVSSKVESSEFTQKVNSISAIFKSIGLDGGQTGITSIGPNGLTVHHSNISYTTSLAADGMKIKDSSGNVVGGVYAVNGAVKAAMQSLFNPQNPNFEVTVKSQNEGETNGLHFRIGGINAGSLVAGINSGGETSLVITSGNYLALSCNGTLRIGNAKNYIELSPYGEGKIVFTGRYGGLCTILFQELYDLIPND